MATMTVVSERATAPKRPAKLVVKFPHSFAPLPGVIPGMRDPAVKAHSVLAGDTAEDPRLAARVRERPIDAVYSGLEGDSTSGSSGIVGGSGAVSGSCSGIVPGSVGMGSSGVGRSGVVPGSWLAISSLLRLGETHLPGPQPAKRVGLGLTAEQPRYNLPE
jgi:hypothetical protein